MSDDIEQSMRVTTTVREHRDMVLMSELKKVNAAARPGLLRHFAVLGAYQYCCIEAGMKGEPKPAQTEEVTKARLSLAGALD